MQLFHTLDPSPFRESDLALEAEEYIVGCVQELPKTQAIRIVIHLPASEVARHPASEVGRAITHYFRYRAHVARRRPRGLTFQSVMGFTVGTRAIVPALHANLPANGSELVLFDRSDAALSQLLSTPPQKFRITTIAMPDPTAPRSSSVPLKRARRRNTNDRSGLL